MYSTCMYIHHSLSPRGTTDPCLCLLPPPALPPTGQRDQALDWQTAPPVFILSYLVLGSEKDARSKDVGLVPSPPCAHALLRCTVCILLCTAAFMQAKLSMLCASLQVLQEFGVKYILNVTTKCPNYFEGEKEFVYKRIAAIDTGTQKLSQHFSEAFEFIGKWTENSTVYHVYSQHKCIYGCYAATQSMHGRQRAPFSSTVWQAYPAASRSQSPT